MPTSTTPKQVFDRVLYEELRFLTQPKVDPAKVRKQNDALQQRAPAGKPAADSGRQKWDSLVERAKERPVRGPRPGVGNPRRESAEQLRRELEDQRRDAASKLGRRSGKKPVEASELLKRAAMSEEAMAAESKGSWDALMEATGLPKKGSKGASKSRKGASGERGGVGSKKAKPAHPAMSDGPSGSGSMPGDSKSSWDALTQAAGLPQKGTKKSEGGKGFPRNRGRGQKGVNSQDEAAVAPTTAWEKAYSFESTSKGQRGKGGGKGAGANGRKGKSVGRGKVKHTF
ncbi:hypothetical protein VUR80DRAFT_7224 [Thermomyces stellatus]